VLKIGLVGAGGIAYLHLRAFVECGLVEEVRIADPSPEARASAQRQFGIIGAAYPSLEALLEDPDLQVLDLCTPPYLHCRQAVAALQAGKHVIVEKPMAMTVAECDEMLATAQRCGRRLFVALSQRMFPAHVRAKELLQAGALGEPLLGVINIYGDEMEGASALPAWQSDGGQAGGGAIFDAGYHAVYMLQHFFGPAQAVVALAKRLRSELPHEAADTAVAALELPGPALGSIVVTCAATGDRWTENRRLVGTQGSLLIHDDPDYGPPLLLLRREEAVPIPVPQPLQLHSYGVARILEHFVECLVRDQPEQVTAAEARAAVATCQALCESERLGQRVAVVG
jgi:predicted dehydrogenase